MKTKAALHLGLLLICSSLGMAAEEPNSLVSALTDGDISLDVRARAEFVDQDGLDSANAFTERARLGYGTRPYYGFTFFLEYEDIRALDDDRYNIPTLNPHPAKAVINDRPDTELNQAFVKYRADQFEMVTGRQRIILDDARFIGNVGWRQNEQTYDAVSLKTKLFGSVDVYYAYLWEVNRIFGPSAALDFQSNTHLINVSRPFDNIGTFTAFAYLLDFDNSPANSSNTYGIRYVGTFDIDKDVSVEPIVSFARQVDAGPNPTNYAADYVLAQVSFKKEAGGTAGGGYELLGTDSGMAAFATPLATLHGMNGWADAFLTTPATGLQDYFIFAGTTLPYEITGKALFHWFTSQQGNTDFGNELDIVFGKAFSSRVNGLVKFATYDGDAGYPDTMKFWVQSEIKIK